MESNMDAVFLTVAVGVLIIGLTFVIVIAVVLLAVDEIQKKRRQARVEDVLDRVEALEAQVANKSIESRLQALETIVTDHRNKLSEEIDTLESTPH